MKNLPVIAHYGSFKVKITIMSSHIISVYVDEYASKMTRIETVGPSYCVHETVDEILKQIPYDE